MPNDVSLRVTRRLPEPVELQLARDYGAVLSPDDVPLEREALRAVLAHHPIVSAR
jgi:hypothetical protein